MKMRKFFSYKKFAERAVIKKFKNSKFKTSKNAMKECKNIGLYVWIITGKYIKVYDVSDMHKNTIIPIYFFNGNIKVWKTQ